MGFFDDPYASTYAPAKPPDASLFEKIVSPVEGALDALASLERTAIYPFAQGGFKWRPTTEELTGSTDPWVNFGVGLATDPLMGIAALGELNLAGKLVAKSAKLSRLSEILTTTGDLTKAAEVTKMLEGVSAELATAGKAKRSLVTLGVPFIKSTNVQLGDTKVLTDLIDKIPQVLTSRSTMLLPDEQAMLVKRLSKLKNPEKIAEAQARLMDVTAQLADPASKGILDIPASKKVYDVIDWFKNRFSSESSEPFIRDLSDVVQIHKREMAIGATEAVHKSLGELEKAIDITNVDAMKKALTAVENPFIVSPTTIPNVQALADADTTKLNAEMIGQLNKQFKKGKLEIRVEKPAIPEGITFPEDIQTNLDRVTAHYVKGIDSIKQRTVERQLHLKAAEKAGLAISPALKEWAISRHEGLANLLDIAQKNRIPLEQLQSSKGLTEYFPRIMSKEAMALKDTNPRLFAFVSGELNPKMGATYQRHFVPERFIVDANDIAKQRYGLEFDWFNTNPIEAEMKYRQDLIKQIGKSQYIQTIDQHFGTTTKSFKATPVKTFYSDFGLSTDGLATGRYIPQSAVDMATHSYDMISEALKAPDNMFSKALQFTDYWFNGLYRAFNTVLFPGFAHRNMMNNFFIEGTHGVLDFGEHARAYAKQMRQIKGVATPADTAAFKEYEAYGMMRGGQSAELKPFLERISPNEDTWFKKFINRPLTTTSESIGKLLGQQQKLKEVSPQAFDPLFGRAYNTFIENNARISTFETLKKTGLTAFEAAQRTNHILFDYSRLTPFEQQYLKPLHLFYTWKRKNIPLMMELAVKNPRVLDTYYKVTDRHGEELPDYLRATDAFPSWWNKNTFIGSLGLSPEDLNMLNVSDAKPFLPDQLKRVFQKWGSNLAPAPLLAFETLTGEKAYTGKPLRDLNWYDYLISMSPASRFYKTGGDIVSAIEGKKPWSDTMINYLAGIRTYTLNRSRAHIDTEKRQALLTGLATEYPIIIPRKGLSPEKDRVIREKIKQIQKDIEHARTP